MTTDEPIEVYGFWRSNAMYRVRVALNLKGLAYREIPVDLDAGAQHAPAFLARNPQGAVPAMMAEGRVLTQSLAILDYLEEAYPSPSLLPPDPVSRARVRAIACTVACDSHPLIVPRVRRFMTAELGLGPEAFRRWLAHWVGRGLEAIEADLASSPLTGCFCHGDSVTIADIYVAGLVMIGRLLEIEAPATPTLTGITERCFSLEAFVAAEPMRQADAPKAT